MNAMTENTETPSKQPLDVRLTMLAIFLLCIIIFPATNIAYMTQRWNFVLFESVNSFVANHSSAVRINLDYLARYGNIERYNQIRNAYGFMWGSFFLSLLFCLLVVVIQTKKFALLNAKTFTNVSFKFAKEYFLAPLGLSLFMIFAVFTNKACLENCGFAGKSSMIYLKDRFFYEDLGGLSACLFFFMLFMLTFNGFIHYLISSSSYMEKEI